MLDVMDSSCPEAIERVLPNLPGPEKVPCRYSSIMSQIDFVGVVYYATQPHGHVPDTCHTDTRNVASKGLSTFLSPRLGFRRALRAITPCVSVEMETNCRWFRWCNGWELQGGFI